MKVLIVGTNHASYPTKNTKTGLWFSELTHFYDVIDQKKLLIDFVSPLGGYIPIDVRSMENKDELNNKYLNNTEFLEKLKHSKKPSEVIPEDYRLLYLAGGPGAMWDFPNNKAIANIAQTIYEKGGMITAVGHGVAGLLGIQLSNGAALIMDKYVTGFSNIEETILSFISEAPFSLEDKLKEHGAHYTKSLIPFREYIEIDERLITGQNHNSAKKIATKALEELFEK